VARSLLVAAALSVACGNRAAREHDAAPASATAPRDAAIAPDAGAAKGQDFISDASLLDRLVACGDGPAPGPAIAPIVSPLRDITRRMAGYRAVYFTPATRAWFAAIEPPLSRPSSIRSVVAICRRWWHSRRDRIYYLAQARR
jgi:hypothetical protein